MSDGAEMGTQATAGPAFETSAYSFLLQVLGNPSLKKEFWPKTTPDGELLLEQAGFAPGADRDQLLTILGWAAFSQSYGEESILSDKKRGDETFAVVAAMKNAMARNVVQTVVAYQRTMWMYMISFYMGVGLIAAAICFAWLGKEPLLPLVFGGLGTANTLTFFLSKPPERLQTSRASLAQLQCAILAWFSDYFNQQAIMNQLNLAGKLDPELFEKLSNNLVERTRGWMELLQNAVTQSSGISSNKPAPGAATPDPE